ncbi:MAG: allophanate hydrolase [Acidihalobacter sp.]|uniref:allophanate hydrolase n=1 Tax=Acidihalobacter sp. TaxID=1872108 RepID=UPI00307D91CC
MIDADTSLDIAALREGYRAGNFTPREVLDLILARIETQPERYVWIRRLTREELYAYADALAGRSVDELPLYGIPFAIKDNIDLAGVPTTAACPEFAYLPERSATVVQRLIDAGAIPLGKTNLDQFATGLVGVRSPHGACRNAFDPDYVSGGSSSGSAVAVATGLASFSLGTDTAGSGRGPAAFNNLVGHKPTRGRLSTRGVLPACRSLDCVSIFALSAGDADAVYRAAGAYDAEDSYSRGPERPVLGRPIGATFRFGVPRAKQLEFFGNAAYETAFAAAVRRLEELGGEAVEIDFGPFLETARLLYEGPWVAERYVAIEDFIEAKPGALHPVTRQITLGGAKPSAAAAFKAEYRRMALQRESESVWQAVEVIVTPSAGTHYRIDEVEADPVTLNSNLGYYTNFMNLLDLSATAVPAGMLDSGLPFGITLFAPAFRDAGLLALAERFQAWEGSTLGATGSPLAAAGGRVESVQDDAILVAVCGAHMTGLPLNHQLIERGGWLVQATQSAPVYRLYALSPAWPPSRPGMVRVAEGGAAIEVEVWAVPAARFGDFVAQIPAPLGFGRLELADGSGVEGFICEPYAVEDAEDITAYGGWRAYLAR